VSLFAMRVERTGLSTSRKTPAAWDIHRDPSRLIALYSCPLLAQKQTFSVEIEMSKLRTGIA